MPEVSAQVEEGSVVVSIGIEGQNLQDVHQATLSAQLAADKQHNRQVEWYTRYKKILETVGFVINSASFQEYSSVDRLLRMDQVSLKVISTLVGAPVMATVTAAMGKKPCRRMTRPSTTSS